MSYQAKDSQVLGRQLKVQTLKIPFVITGNATPASKTQVSDEPALVFFRTEGKDDITAATGALDADDTAPTLATANDGNGIFSVLVRLNEPVAKLVSVRLVRRGAGGVETASLPSAPATGIVAGGRLDKIVVNVDTSVDLSAANLDAVLEVDYVAEQSE